MDERWIEIKFDEIEKRLDQAFRLRDQALRNSKEELRDRLDKMNEIREQLDRQASSFVSRDWVEARFLALDRMIGDLNKSVNTLETRAAAVTEKQDRRLIIFGLIVAALQILVVLLMRSTG